MNANSTTTNTNSMTDSYYPDGAVMLLMQEDLARTRMRESQRAAAEWRLARRLTSAKRWSRLARWAARHAAEANSSL
jgi:hypothetical protein